MVAAAWLSLGPIVLSGRSWVMGRAGQSSRARFWVRGRDLVGVPHILTSPCGIHVPPPLMDQVVSMSKRETRG